MTNTRYRHNVQLSGDGECTLVFGHGFGCDQSMWRLLAPAFADRFRIVLFDLMGSGYSDVADYAPLRYGSLQAHADDVINIVDVCTDGPVIFIGHSVSATIGMLAANKAPQRFAAQVMISPSPCYLNDGDYPGGSNPEDIAGLLQLMDHNWLKWAARMGPVIMGAPDRPDLQQELSASFCRVDPKIARHFGRVTFLSINAWFSPKLETVNVRPCETLKLASAASVTAPKTAKPLFMFYPFQLECDETDQLGLWILCSQTAMMSRSSG